MDKDNQENVKKEIEKQNVYRSCILLATIGVTSFALIMGFFFLNDYIMLEFRTGAAIVVCVGAGLFLVNEYEQKDN